MQIKNKIISIIVFFLCFFTHNLNLQAEEFNISAKEILIEEVDTVVGKGNVEITDNTGKTITGNKVVYIKSKEFLTVEGLVSIFDDKGNILKTDKAIYDKKKEIITAYENSELLTNEGYKLTSNKILYNDKEKVITSDQNSTLTDMDGNSAEVDMFQYDLGKKLFSSLGKIKVIDINNNKYFFKELHVDTNTKEMIGSDISVLLDQENFGVSKENDPRFVANEIFMTKNKTSMSKGVFTVCKIRDGKCPPWSLQAKKIVHDKVKKTIYYDHAKLKFYDIPIFYFPKFFHPDPSVKRQSGFLPPFFSESTTVGTGFGLPYFWAISHDKDLTFTPKIYTKENVLFLNEYRQAFRNGFLSLDTSYTQGYKETSNTKTAGSRNHVFAQLDLDLGKDKSYDSNLLLKVQKTSNDTFFRIHDINTILVDAENTDLRNEINYNFNKGNTYLNISGAVYENLRERTNSRYEYVLPNILFGKSFFTEKFGSINFQSNAYYNNYEVNKHTTFLVNDVVWNSDNYITPKGFVNSLEGKIKNTNYEAKNTSGHKTAGATNELAGLLSFKSSLPMQKEGVDYNNIFSPNFMVKYSPKHMRDLSDSNLTLNYNNLFSSSKINEDTVIDGGINAILGFDFQINEKDKTGNEKEKLSISMGQVFSPEKNENMPSKSSLDQKMSDIVGEVNYNFSKIGSIDYKFSVDHNLNDINYNEISTNLNFGKVGFNLDYLEEQNHIGNEHYVNTGISLKINDYNKLSFETKKNYKTDSTELYDINYQYINDCLTAGLVYRREFYQDSDVGNKDSLMFVITFKPFTGVKTPSFINP